MKIVNFDPNKGMARQGDIIIWRLPDGFELNTQHKIKERDGRLILAEGEATGHRHSILARFEPVYFRDDAMAAASMAQFAPTIGTATLYQDDGLTQLLAKTYLVSANLCVGYLRVCGAPVLLEHQEHDALRIPPGTYYVGRQQEFSAGELRRVAD